MISGLSLHHGWLSPDACDDVASLTACALLPLRRRGIPNDRSKVLRYGWSYETAKDIHPRRLDAWPDWLEKLRQNLPYPPSIEGCAITLNEYALGYCIGPHVDSEAFGDVIQILSLGSPAEMEFSAADATHSLTLTPGSLLFMQGPARHEWKHAIKPVPALRHSIVFREILTAGSSMTTTTMS